MDGISFQTRARTIDHLGRGQIADAPTAVSELWKNAYDAYAKNVSLHLFDGTPNIGAIFDDGIGMNRDDVVRRWLVIGTESKIEDFDAPPVDTLGLPIRPRQGEKGIGRLSVAFLAPATVLVSKRANSPYVAVIVDWRLFENPFLSLEDIRLPVEEFADKEALLEGLPAMLVTLKANLGGKGDNRSERLAEGWRKFSEYEAKLKVAPATRTAIEALWEKPPLTSRHLDEWEVVHGLADHGTALFIVDLNHELAVWVNPSEEDDEVTGVKQKLLDTLHGFTDPYAEKPIAFGYEVYVHNGLSGNAVVRAADVFGRDGLHDLEHYIDGRFDERGTFTGRVVAFGQDLGIQTYTPPRLPPTKGRDKLGAFEFSIGTIEQDERRSTHTENQHQHLLAQADKFGGLAVYRDNLRIMPYGRPDADFLGMEERRSKHAGREFWAHRRSFGHVAFTRDGNPALRDKAGREGLIDNRAFREMRILLIEFIKDAARKYFGTDSPVRSELLPGIMERKALQREAADKARARRRRTLRQFLKEQNPPLNQALDRAEGLIALAKDTLTSKDKTQAVVVAARIHEIRGISESLRPPTPPAKLGDLEEQWRAYRDDYQGLLVRVEELSTLSQEMDALIRIEDPRGVLRQRFDDQQGVLASQLNVFRKEIDLRLNTLHKNWDSQIDADIGEMERRLAHVLEAEVTTKTLLNYLNLIDVNRTEISEAFASRYPPFLNTLDQLIEGIDLEGAYAITEDDRAELEDKLRDIQQVAQIGVTVEIIGHEFEALESEVRRNLAKLPQPARDTAAYKQALRAHLALADRLRFLTPMKVGGYRSREIITGEQIASYVEEFFANVFAQQRIEFTATKAFRKIAITDIPSRIFPAIINLVNNAVYWTSQAENRQILMDFKDGLVILGDTGPGVDREDVSRLFTLFFTRRTMGRGVGLYLSRVNLAVAGHKIRYATGDDPTVMPGANFIIEFKGVQANG